jgi:hypothetical protein
VDTRRVKPQTRIWYWRWLYRGRDLGTYLLVVSAVVLGLMVLLTVAAWLAGLL